MRSLWLKYVSKVAGRLMMIALIVLGAFVGKQALMSLKKPPTQAAVAERELTVEVHKVYPKDVPVVLTGFGEARPLNVVNIAAEVPGQVVSVHPNLEVGELIPEGEVLFKIDPRDYEAALGQAEAQVAAAKSNIERLKTQYETDKERVATLRRSRDLARQEFERVQTLLNQDSVGTQSGVDQTEMAFNQTNDAYDLLVQNVSLFPIRIEEAESSLAGAEAQRDRARANLDRCTMRAPFDARLKMVQLEAGQYAQPGSPLLTLADDSMLEVSVSLPSSEIQSWLQFENSGGREGQAWFNSVAPVKVRVSWTENPKESYWEGTLHRVQSFERETLTATVAVRISGEQARSGHGGLPLVAGMFCSVSIPGKTMEGVFEVPPWAVSYEGEVYVDHEGRLQRRKVKRIREQGDAAYISEGLSPGDSVIVTRLVDPLPNTKLKVEPAAGSAPAEERSS